MSKLDHHRRAQSDRLRRQGAEAVSDLGLVIPARTRTTRSRPSKAHLRAEAGAAIEKITRTVKCAGCGHRGKVVLPASTAGKRLRCTRCGEIGS